MDIWTAIDRVGFPIVALVLTFFALWKILKWAGVNIVTPIAKSHIALVEQVQIASKNNSETLTKVSDLLEIKTKAMVQLAKQNEETVRLTVDANSKLDGIAKAIPEQTKELSEHLTILAEGLKK